MWGIDIVSGMFRYVLMSTPLSGFRVQRISSAKCDTGTNSMFRDHAVWSCVWPITTDLDQQGASSHVVINYSLFHII